MDSNLTQTFSDYLNNHLDFVREAQHCLCSWAFSTGIDARCCPGPRAEVLHPTSTFFIAFSQLSGPGRGLLSNPFLPTPPCRFGTAMAGTYALVGGRVGTGEVCLVGVQSDFPAPAVHRERQRPDRPGPRPSAPLKLYMLRGEAAHLPGRPESIARGSELQTYVARGCRPYFEHIRRGNWRTRPSRWTASGCGVSSRPEP